MVGLKWSVVQQIVFQGMNYGSLLLLANLVSIQHFGTVALCTVLVGLFEMLNGFGMGSLIIKDMIRDDRSVSTLFWMSVGLSLLLYVLFLLAGLGYSYFYRAANLLEFYSILAVSGVTILFNGSNEIFAAQYRRDLDFKFAAVSDTGSIFLSVVVSLLLAKQGFGVWALVAKNVIPVVAQWFFYWWHGRYKILAHFDKAYARSHGAFTFHLSSFSVINYLIRNLDYVIVGKFLGESALGEYTLAYKFMLFPMKNVTSRVQTLLFPVLAAAKEAPARLASLYFKAVSLIAYAVFPVMFLASALAEIWVSVVFSQKFPHMIALVQILAIVGAVQSTTSPVGMLFMIAGRTDAMLKVSLVQFLILGSGFLLGGLSGSVVTFALIYGVLYVFVAFPLSNVVPFRLSGFKLSSLSNALYQPALAASLSAGLAWVTGYLTADQAPLVRLAVSVFSGCASYLFFIQWFSGRSLAENREYCLQLWREARR